jgi:hypothetical protein
MKNFLVAVLMICILPSVLEAQKNGLHRGVIVRMRMGECLPNGHSGFVGAMAGGARQTDELCPEYTLVTDKVVYVIVGKVSGQIIPLAETTEFRIFKNELLIRVDDAMHETKFTVKEMALRPDWESERVRSVEEPIDENRPHLPEPSFGGPR